MEDVESLIDEGNLTVAEILEGLLDVGEDLRQSEDTEDAGQGLIEGNLDEAASELEGLAEELGTGREPQSDLVMSWRKPRRTDGPGWMNWPTRWKQQRKDSRTRTWQQRRRPCSDRQNRWTVWLTSLKANDCRTRRPLEWTRYRTL